MLLPFVELQYCVLRGKNIAQKAKIFPFNRKRSTSRMILSISGIQGFDYLFFARLGRDRKTILVSCDFPL